MRLNHRKRFNLVSLTWMLFKMKYNLCGIFSESMKFNLFLMLILDKKKSINGSPEYMYYKCVLMIIDTFKDNFINKFVIVNHSDICK